MKKELLAALFCMTIFTFTSCGEKKPKDKFQDRIENAQKSVEKAMDDTKEKIEEGADNLEDAIDEVKEKLD